MKALRLDLYQETACYKKPFAFKVSETYPLPPYSTVKGMLHYLLEANTFIPMKISVQGSYDTLTTDYQTHYFFKKATTSEFILTSDGLGAEQNLNDITTMPIYMHMLYNVHLIIHIYAEESVMDQIFYRINHGETHLSLGRREDLVRIDRCELVEIGEFSHIDEDPVLQKNVFIPLHLLDDDNLPPYYLYKLNTFYRIIKGVRVWDKLETAYVPTGESLDSDDDLIIDSYGDFVFWANIHRGA